MDRERAARLAKWGLADAAVVVASLCLAWAVRFITAERLVIPGTPVLLFGLVAIAVYCSVNYLFRLYHRIWPYASAGEVVAIAESVALGSGLLVLDDLMWPGGRAVPLSVIPLMSLFAGVGFTVVRYRSRLLTGLNWRWWALLGRFPPDTARVLIVGAGEAGQLLGWRFRNQAEGASYHLVGYVDDNSAKLGMRVHGAPVLGDRHAIPQVVAEYRVDLIVIAIHRISGDQFRALLDICESTQAVIKVLPNIFTLMDGTNGVAPIRDITAEDLLGRKPVEIDVEACRRLVGGKTILVTGAAGSIGSELCRQIAAFRPRRLLILDNNESGVHDLFITLRLSRPEDGDGSEEPMVPIVADITNTLKMERVLALHRPQIVFHAAAYKHVPLMEAQPEEAVRVNILGTRTVADLAAKYGAERFVLVSTDKAINAESVMGATKRVCEMLTVGSVQHQRGGNGHGPVLGREPNGTKPATAAPGRTIFTAVRFGNVIGSRGSVVPTFERQIEQGGPLTITHPEMTRFFMSIPEAVSLIIQAATLTGGDDIFMLDMGERICIDSLARRLVRLRGLRPGVDIPIVYTGIRPGEKMHEELLGEGEERHFTGHPHIFRIQSHHMVDPARLQRRVEEMAAITMGQREGDLVALLKETVRLPLVVRQA